MMKSIKWTMVLSFHSQRYSTLQQEPTHGWADKIWNLIDLFPVCHIDMAMEKD